MQTLSRCQVSKDLIETKKNQKIPLAIERARDGRKEGSMGAEGPSLLLALKSMATAQDLEGSSSWCQIRSNSVSHSSKGAHREGVVVGLHIVFEQGSTSRGGCGGHKLPSISRLSEGAHWKEGGGHKLPSVSRSSEGGRREEGDGGH